MLKPKLFRRGLWLVAAIALLFAVGCEEDKEPMGPEEPTNNAPVAQNGIQDLLGFAEEYVAVDETLVWNLEGATQVFIDQDDDNLTYTASSSDDAIATASVTGTDLSVTGVSAGTATITVEATDGDSTASVNYDFTVVDGKISGDIEQDTTWSADKEYLMIGQTFVVAGITLTIEPGTVIKSLQNDANGNAPALVIERGGKIMAEGTADNPITFTSVLPEDQLPQRGTWGGLIILGKAPVNIGEGFVEGLVGVPYGGSDPHDDSGVLKYVRVWYGGRSIGQDDEINGISFAGVGDGTVVEHCEVAYNLDDGFEFWGGTVNAKYLSSVFCGDDDFDTDLGYRGKGQYLFSIKGQEEAGRGFEMDNNGDDYGAQPRSYPQFHNVTLIGPGGGSPTGDGTDQMIRLREGTAGDFRNVLITDGLGLGVRVTHTPELAATNAPVYPTDADSLYFSSNNVIYNVPGDLFKGEQGDKVVTLPWSAQELDPQFTNVPTTREGTVGIDPTPTNSDVLTGGEILPGGDGFFDTDPGFIGAFGSNNWLEGWSILSP